MTCYQDIAACPTCGSETYLPVLPDRVTFDNSLEPIIRAGQDTRFPGFNAADYARVFWSACSHCGTLFARRRPALNEHHPWYVALFQVSEERTYNTYPLPSSYLEGKASGSLALFDRLKAADVFTSAGSVLHLRCAAGHLLKLIADTYPDIAVFGAEYFENPARHARDVLADGQVALIDGPEPQNPFEREGYDVILVNHFMTHAPDPARYIDYLLTLTAPGGSIVIYNELDHELSLQSMSAYPRGLNFFHKQLYTRRTLTALLRSRGLQVRDIDVGLPGKLPKYMTLICTRGAVQPVAAGDSAAARLLLSKWWRRSRFYRRMKWAIQPIRKTLRAVR